MALKHSTKETILIHVYYDKELAEIAGTSEEKIGVPKGMTSANFLKHILKLHPEMKEKFKQQELSFEHKGHAASSLEKDELKDNDTYVVATWTMKEMRDSLKEMLEFVVECFSIPITLEETLTFIFTEEYDEADRKELLHFFIKHVPEPGYIRTVYGLVNQAWLFFPHHRLNGQSPVETLQKVVHDRSR